MSDDLRAAIARVLNQHSAENTSNTPDYILAQFLESSLAAFDAATQQRETWYGRDARPTLAAAERAAVPRKLWLWKNFVDGKPEYWAFDNPFPIYMDNGDPQTFGQPCGYALFKRSRRGRDDVSDEQVLADIRRAAESGIGPCVGPADRSNHCGRCGSPPGQPCRNRPPLAAAAPDPHHMSQAEQRAVHNALYRSAKVVHRGEPTAAPADDLERECADADRICAALGLTVEQSRTDGGSLNVPRIIAHISETLTALRESHAFGVAMSDKYVASRAPECAAAQKPVAWATPSLLVTLSAVEKNHLTNPDRRTRGGEFESAAADAERYSVPLYAAPPAPASEPTRHPCGHLIVSDECVVCAKPASEPQAEPTAAPDDAPADDLVDRLRRSSKANAGTGVGMFADEVLAALAALRAENGRLRDNLASKTAERDVALGALAEQEERAERAESQLAAAQAVLAAAHDALTEIALAGMSLPMVCGDDEETKNRFHARRAWEFIGIAARAKTEIDAARAAAGGGK